jgi:hypothetical protein
MNTNLKFNIFESLKSKTTFKYMELNEVLELIKNGDADKPLIEAARLVGKGHASYKIIKDNRLSISWNSILNDGKKKSDFKAMTGLMYTDKDNLTVDEINNFKQALMIFPYVIAVWVSFGAKGIGCLINIDGIPEEKFLSAWEQINKEIGIGFDEKVKSIANMNVLSYDPDIRINYSSTPFPFINENVSTTGEKKYLLNVTNEITEKGHYDNIYTSSCVYEHNTLFEKTIYNSTVSYKTVMPEYVFDGAPYKIFPETVPFYQVNTFLNFTEGGRNQAMHAIASNLFKINPFENKQSILLEMYKINKLQCKPPLLSSEISKIVNGCYKTKIDGKLAPRPGRRTIVLNEALNTNLTTKRKNIGTATGELRRERTKDSIQKGINTLKIVGKKITQKDVALAANKCIKTIKNHWHFFKVDITEFNKNIAAT